MTWRIEGHERNICPPEIQAQLTHLGGENKYSEPNFILRWAQYSTFTAGGVWSVDEQYFKGYRQLLQSNEPCWTLYQWHAPEEYGTPESYYVGNYDEETGLQMLGEYPYSGRYELLYNLRWHEMEDGKLKLHSIPLSSNFFDLIVPIIILAKGVSIEKRKAAFLEARKREEDEKLGDIERHLRDGAVPFGGSAVSFTKQGIRSTEIDRKMLEMQRAWSQLSNAARTFRPGIQTR